MQRGKKKKGHLSFPAPWEFQTSVSFLRAPGPSLLLGDPGRRTNLRRNWLSQPHALCLFCPVSLSVVLPLRGFLKDAGWAGSSILPLPAVFSMSSLLPHGSLTAAPCLAHALFSVKLARVIRDRDLRVGQWSDMLCSHSDLPLMGPWPIPSSPWWAALIAFQLGFQCRSSSYVSNETSRLSLVSWL